MKLKDFLKEFEGVDPESEMYFYMADGCCGDCFHLDDPWVDHWRDDRSGNGYCRVDFPALEFLVSCRSSSAARSAGMSVIKRK